MKKKKPIEKDTQDFLERIGKRMVALRKKKGYKNHEIFAYENKIPRAQYGRYEHGQDLQMSSFKKVLNGFGITAILSSFLFKFAVSWRKKRISITLHNFI